MDTPFRAMTFVKNDVITTDKMDQLDSNHQWLLENTPRSKVFVGNGTATNLLTKGMVVGGKVAIKKNLKEQTAKVRVNLGSAFDPKCQPHVTTGIVSDFQRKIFCVINGPGGKDLPNASGFEVVINIAADAKKHDKIEKGFYVCWSAFGWRRDNVDEF